MSDMGVWRCNVTAESQRHVHGEWRPLDAATIDSVSVNIQLIIISKFSSCRSSEVIANNMAKIFTATLGPPNNPTIKDIGATWLQN